MTFQGWYSKQDVIQDLMLATGKYVLGIDEHVLVGEEPPRPTEHTLDEDTEMQLLRLNGGYRPQNANQMSKPDLAGITQMLRMVDRLSDHTKQKPQSVDTADNRSTEHILSISKLNPEVQEFIPKNNCTSDFVRDTKPNKTDRCVKDTALSLNNSIDKTQFTNTEMQDMREKLKCKITLTSNTSCVKTKRERNLAMATLLKLCCKSPKTSVVNCVQPTLMTPEYYETSIKKNKTENIECINNLENTESAINECTENEIDKYDNCVAASVHKVQKWLSASAEDSEMPVTEINSQLEKINQHSKTSPIYLGPVTFKRKAATKPTSSTSSECERTKSLKSTHTVFVPSAYAGELTKTYMERSRLNEGVDNNLWTMVDNAIKAKESQNTSPKNGDQSLPDEPPAHDEQKDGD